MRIVAVTAAVAAACILTACSKAQSPDPASAGQPAFIAETGRGWQEAVVSVRAFAPTRDFMVEVAGYEVRETGALDPAWLSAWGLPEGASGAYELLVSPGKSVGWVRLVQLTGWSSSSSGPAPRSGIRAGCSR